MKLSTSFKLTTTKNLMEKIKEAIHPKDAENLSVNVELSYEISSEELKELYREYRSEVDASSSDVSNFLSQISKLWAALKNGIHDILHEIVESEDVIFDVQNAVHRLRKNAADNKSEFHIYTKKLAKEEEKAEEEINKKTEE